MQTFESAHGHIHQPHQGHAHALVQQQHSSNGASVARSKHLTVSIAEDPMRSLSASPGPGGAHSDVETNSYLNDPPSSGEGEGMESQFGRAPKSAKSSGSGAGSAKRKAAPRTSRACRTCISKSALLAADLYKHHSGLQKAKDALRRSRQSAMQALRFQR